MGIKPSDDLNGESRWVGSSGHSKRGWRHSTRGLPGPGQKAKEPRVVTKALVTAIISKEPGGGVRYRRGDETLKCALDPSDLCAGTNRPPQLLMYRRGCAGSAQGVGIRSSPLDPASCQLAGPLRVVDAVLKCACQPTIKTRSVQTSHPWSELVAIRPGPATPPVVRQPPLRTLVR